MTKYLLGKKRKDGTWIYPIFTDPVGPYWELEAAKATRFDSATAAHLAAIEAGLAGYEVVPVEAQSTNAVSDQENQARTQ